MHTFCVNLHLDYSYKKFKKIAKCLGCFWVDNCLSTSLSVTSLFPTMFHTLCNLLVIRFSVVSDNFICKYWNVARRAQEGRSLPSFIITSRTRHTPHHKMRSKARCTVHIDNHNNFLFPSKIQQEESMGFTLYKYY